MNASETLVQDLHQVPLIGSGTVLNVQQVVNVPCQWRTPCCFASLQRRFGLQSLGMGYESAARCGHTQRSLCGFGATGFGLGSALYATGRSAQDVRVKTMEFVQSFCTSKFLLGLDFLKNTRLIRQTNAISCSAARDCVRLFHKARRSNSRVQTQSASLRVDASKFGFDDLGVHFHLIGIRYSQLQSHCQKL